MKIRLAADLQIDSIVDGVGIRTVIWTQGCSHNCPFCHNPSTHSFDGGELVSVDDVVSRLSTLEMQDGVTFSGGDPMFQPKPCAYLAKKIHELGMNIWVYTGFTYEELLAKNDKDIMDFLNNIDVLVDGRFDISKKSMDLEFRGSSNQRIIDVKKSLMGNNVVLYDLHNKSKIASKEVLYI